MMGWPRQGGGAGGGSRAHHIDEIAHHFLAEDDVPPADIPAVVVDAAIAAAGPGRAAACAAAGLAVAAGTIGLGSCLIEDDAVAWSSFSFLGQSPPRALPPPLAADLPRGVRCRRVDDGAPVPRSWVRWRLLGEASEETLAAWEVPSGLPAAARARMPRWGALVWCVAPHDAALSAAQDALRRLVGLLEPSHVEFLVLPTAWDARPGGWRLIGRRSDPGWHNLAHLQEVVRAAVGERPAVVRLVPDVGVAGAEAVAVLAEIAGAVAGSSAARAAG
ncbi:MAG: hypothetical protein IPK64_08615 [bacterium]|nr:hypothetical protein [bacterium]